MITCPVCGHHNDDLTVLCTSCHSYIQSKVDNLDLFKTMWQLIETPRLAFKRIILSNHKNYVLLLSSMFGISAVFGVVWVKTLGPQFGNLFTLIGSVSLVGIPFGITIVVLLSLVLILQINILKGKAGFKNAVAVVAYAGIPVVLSLVFVFPLEIAVFGIDFFGNNPPPNVLNPLVYMALLGFDGLAIGWSFVLLYHGIGVLSGFARVRALISTAVVALVPGMVTYGLKLM
jgi:Yip1 domain